MTDATTPLTESEHLAQIEAHFDLLSNDELFLLEIVKRQSAKLDKAGHGVETLLLKIGETTGDSVVSGAFLVSLLPLLHEVLDAVNA